MSLSDYADIITRYGHNADQLTVDDMLDVLNGILHNSWMPSREARAGLAISDALRTTCHLLEEAAVHTSPASNHLCQVCLGDGCDACGHFGIE